jgi:hypothetical protein
MYLGHLSDNSWRTLRGRGLECGVGESWPPVYIPGYDVGRAPHWSGLGARWNKPRNVYRARFVWHQRASADVTRVIWIKPALSTPARLSRAQPIRVALQPNRPPAGNGPLEVRLNHQSGTAIPSPRVNVKMKRGEPTQPRKRPVRW